MSAARCRRAATNAVPSSGMDEPNLAKLPVADEAGRFLGIIERDKVTGSIVLDLVARP